MRVKIHALIFGSVNMKDSTLYYCIRIYKSRNNGFQCTLYKTNTVLAKRK